MTITAIIQQERLKGRYSIFVDDKYAFSLSANALLDEKLYQGQELSAEELKNYKKLSQDDKALGLALAYAARRMRSRYEFGEYFRRKQYDEALAAHLMAKLEQYGYVDDSKFAEAWVSNRRLLKPVSKRRLVQELRQKRVESSIIDAVLAEDETDERDTLKQLVERKRRQTRYQDTQKLMQYLARQGFSYDDIKAVLAEV